MKALILPSKAPGAFGNKLALFLSLMCIVVAGSARSAVFTWNGAGADNNWSTAANWGGVAPVLSDSTQDLQFIGNTRLAPNAEAAYSVKAIYFGPTSGVRSTADGNFVLSGGNLTLAGGSTNAIFNNTDKAQVINNNITVSNAANSAIASNANAGKLTLNGTVTMGFASGSLSINAYSFGTTNAIVVNGAISGAGNLSLGGNGANNSSSIYLNGPSNYTGSTTVAGVTAYLGGNAPISSSGVFGSASTAVGLGGAVPTGDNNSYTSVLTNGAFTIDRSFLVNQTSGSYQRIVIGGGSANVSNFTGTVQVSNGAVAATPLILTAASGGTVNFTGTNKQNSNIIFRQVAATGTADTLTKVGAGTVTLQDQSNYQGATIIDAGTLSVNLLANGGASGSALGMATNAASNLRIQGGTLQYTGVATSTDRLFTIAPTGATLDASGTGAVNFSNTGAIVTADAASRQAKLNTSTSVTFLTTDVGAGADVGDLKTGVTVTGTGIQAGTTVSSASMNAVNGVPTLTLSQAATSTGVVTLSFGVAANTALTLTGNNTGANTIAGSLGNSVGGSVLGVTKTGVGTWVLAGNNTYTGLTTVSTGTLGLSGNNTAASGGVTLSAGQLNINNARALGSGTLTVSGGTLDNTSGGAIINAGNNSQAWNGNFAFAGSNALDLGTGAVTMNADRTVTVTAGNLTVGGAIGGAFNLYKAGAGTLTLAGNNTYSGYMQLQAGTLKLGGTGALGTKAVLISSGATLDLNGVNYTTALSLGSSTSGEITNSSTTDATFTQVFNSTAGTASTVSGTGNITFSGVFSGSFLTKNGNNTVTFGGSGTNSGLAVTVNSGTVILNKSATGGLALRGSNAGDALAVNTGGTAKMGANDQIRSSASDVLTGIVSVYGGTFDLNTTTQTVNGLQIGAVDGSTAGNVISTGGGGTLTVSGNATWGVNKIVGNNGTVSANLAGANATFTKATSGTVTLSGTNTYGGTTIVSAGTLLIDGANNGAGAMTVQSGGTLGGHGSIAAAVTVQSGGFLSPGNSPGNITVANSVTILDGGTTTMEINGSAVGTGYDRITMTGAASVFALTGTNNLALSLGYSPADDALFFLVDNQGSSAISGIFEQLNGVTTDLSQGQTFTVGLQQFKISYTADLTGNTFLGGNDLALQAVPEPSTWALLAFTLTTAMVLRRRKTAI